MTGLPRTAEELEQIISDEESCIALVRRYRWGPFGFWCPRCFHNESWQLRTRAVDECRACGKQVSLTAGTIFAGTRKPFRLWFRVLSEFLVDKRGCSALHIARKYGLSYQTAWTWLHKFRSLMNREGRDPLCMFTQLDVNIDPPLVASKALLAMAAVEQKSGGAISRIRMAPLQYKSDCEDFPRENIAEASVIDLYPYPEFDRLTWLGFLPRSKKRGQLRWTALVFRLLKRQVLGTYHGAISVKHFKRYLDEFVFRFNRRASRNRWLLVDRLLGDMPHPVPTYRRIVGLPARSG